MPKPEFTIKPERPEDIPALNQLAARAFGPGRFARTAYRLRETRLPDATLSFVAWADGRAAGSIRFTAVRIGWQEGALLLGPLSVDPDYAGQGGGRALVVHGLKEAREAGYKLVILVGDAAYFEKAGFQPVPPGQITFPGPVNPARILAAELEEGALERFEGVVG
jgi:predicted N-acetyltransferase YhbS